MGGGGRKIEKAVLPRPASPTFREFFPVSKENSAAEVETDLFGAPITQIRERWGRPSFAKTKENQELVALLRAAGWKQGRIARYLGCDEKTLRKHFSRELSDGADLIEGMALEVTLKKMRSGNSVATNRIFEIVDRGRIEPPAPNEKPEPKAEPMGKKAQASLDAKNAHHSSQWGNLLQ